MNWTRFKTHLYHNTDLGVSLDISRVPFPDDFFSAREAAMQEAFTAMAQLEASMAGNPVMEKMMGKVGEVTVEKGSAPRKIAGYDTEHYVMTMGENFRQEVWAAPALTPPLQYFDAQSAMYAAMGPLGRKFQKMGDELRKIKGFPLATTTSGLSPAS